MTQPSITSTLCTLFLSGLLLTAAVACGARDNTPVDVPGARQLPPPIENRDGGVAVESSDRASERTVPPGDTSTGFPSPNRAFGTAETRLQ